MESKLTGGRVRLRNGLETGKDPDVRLLWMIGNNYLGQTNDADRKQQTLRARLNKGGPGQGKQKRPIRPPAPAAGQSLTVDQIADSLGKRIDGKSVVLIHQDLFENPTTTLCDLVIPAAGWGEDTFCRYNAQRRLKLYDRFQDMPLHEEDAGDGDPLSRVDEFRYSPKPDWMIFRDVARRIGWLMDGERGGTFFEKLNCEFSWREFLRPRG